MVISSCCLFDEHFSPSSLLMEQLPLGHLGASMLLRHTPVHRANMKYSGIKTSSVFQTFSGKCLAFSCPPLIVFLVVLFIYFFPFEAPPVLLVYFSSLGSLSFFPLSTNSGYWHWLNQTINDINPDSLTQQMALPELFFYTLFSPFFPPPHFTAKITLPLNVVIAFMSQQEQNNKNIRANISTLWN